MAMSTTTIRRSLLMLLAAAACQSQGTAPRGSAAHSPNPSATDGAVRTETVATGLSNPWGIEPLPDGRFLVTERPGRLRIVAADGKLSEPITGVPAVYASGQGGLLDVALDPAFATNSIIYLSYAEPGPNGSAGTAVTRARLTATGLQDPRVIYQQQPKVTGGNHFGSRIAFNRDGTMWITQGDRFAYRDQAQDLKSDLGKVVRLNTDGTVPRDNPFVGRS